MRKTIVSAYLVVCFLFLGITSLSYADNADVLPKGVFSVSIDNKFYSNIDERYNPDGDVENVAIDYNTTLGGNIFRALGSENIGRSVVSFDYHYTITEFTFMYGITDRLTAGIMIPYWWVKNEVKAELDTSRATLWKNPFYGTPGDPFGVPFIPKGTPGGRPLSVEDVQQILIQQFGYKRFETWSDNGVSDIEVGLRYQYLKTDKWRLAFTGGVRIPTGQVSDFNSLVDRPFGSGAYALLFRLNNDYTGIKNLVLNATVRYDLYLPANETLRVPDNVNQPITTNIEEVDRNIGDVVELEASGKYEFFKGFSVSGLYKYGFAQKDRVSGHKGFAYESLELETNYTEHIYIIGLCYSTFPLFFEKKFPLPLQAYISYRNRFAGSNNALKSQYIGAGLQVFF
jgi:hypothetical protein